MFYNALGRVTWAFIKRFLRRKYGPTYLPKPVVAGAVLIAAIAAVLVAQRRENAG